MSEKGKEEASGEGKHNAEQAKINVEHAKKHMAAAMQDYRVEPRLDYRK